MKRTLVLGLGNEILTDDSIGPRIVNDLKPQYSKQGIEFATACCGGLEIIEYIEGFDKVILIDAILTGKDIPGTVYYFKPSDFTETLHLSNLHDISFLTALSLGNTLNLKLPLDIDIIAIEILVDREFGEKLSPELSEKYPHILSSIKKEIDSVLLSF